MDMALLYSSLLPSPCRWHIRVRAGHQLCTDPPCMPLASLGHCWHSHNGTPVPTGVSGQDSYVPRSLPLKMAKAFKYFPDGTSGSRGRTGSLRSASGWKTLEILLLLKNNACLNSVEWGQKSSLMFKTIIQWLHFFCYKETPGLKRLFSCLLPPRNTNAG